MKGAHGELGKCPDISALLDKLVHMEEEKLQIAQQDFITTLSAQEHGRIGFPFYELEHAVLRDDAEASERFIAVLKRLVNCCERIMDPKS